MQDQNKQVKKTINEKELETLKYWQDNQIFEKSLESPAGRKGEEIESFSFYDGPPFATGLPHHGHILAGTIKDAIPRYQTMNGKRVRRVWGWDCHGLPIENLVEKEFNLNSKKDIETYGIDKFNSAAAESVLRYEAEWKKAIPRLGRWVDMEKAYKTMDANYTETVWWVWKSLYDKGLAYEGHKIMHICPRCETPLAQSEVGLEYHDITDMTVTVEKGQKVALTLPDKSRVWVNSGSTMTYGSRFNSKERIIQLNGEAYFEVAKNKNAPFIVQSQGFSVEALGTAFDVKAYPDENQISTVLMEGKVVVGDGLNKINLSPNQRVTYNRDTKNMQKSDVADGLMYADWRYNKLTFNAETFEDIASVLERNYNVKFVFEAQSLKNYRYSGTIGNTSLESLLQIFAMTSPITYHMKDSVIYMNENKKLMPYYKKVLK